MQRKSKSWSVFSQMEWLGCRPNLRFPQNTNKFKAKRIPVRTDIIPPGFSIDSFKNQSPVQVQGISQKATIFRFGVRFLTKKSIAKKATATRIAATCKTHSHLCPIQYAATETADKAIIVFAGQSNLIGTSDGNLLRLHQSRRQHSRRRVHHFARHHLRRAPQSCILHLRIPPAQFHAAYNLLVEQPLAP